MTQELSTSAPNELKVSHGVETGKTDIKTKQKQILTIFERFVIF